MSSRRRLYRIAGWVVFAVSVPPLLLGSYICAWLAFTWWTSTPVRPADPYRRTIIMHPAFEPIYAYMADDRPGADLLWKLHCLADRNCE